MIYINPMAPAINAWKIVLPIPGSTYPNAKVENVKNTSSSVNLFIRIEVRISLFLSLNESE
jgi:hypothetical protein